MNRKTVWLAMVILVASAAMAQVRPGFEPSDIVRQVRASLSTHRPPEPLNPGLDDGEFLIDTSRVYVPALGREQSPVVAFGGQSFLVVWVDDRSGTSAIFGTRVSQSGTILDPDGIAISTVAGDKSLPTVASDDAGFLVVWADRRNGEGDIFGARVSQSGSVLDPDGVAISTASGAQDAPAVAFDGSNYMEVWVDGRNGGRGDIYGARVSPSGVVLDPDGLAVSVRACQHRSPAIASDGANFFAVWDDRRNDSGFGIYGARVSAAGTVLDTGGIGISEMTDHQSDATVAFDGSNFLVVWCNSHSGANIFGARVNQSGIVLDSSGFAVSSTSSEERAPAIAFDGASFLVTWQDQPSDSMFTNILGARVSPSGSVLDPDGIAISTAANRQRVPAVAYDGTDLLVVWEDWRSSELGDIYGTRVTPSGVVLDSTGFVASTAVSAQQAPALAFDGENFLVVWQDVRGPADCDVYGARVTAAGVVLDSASVAISTEAYSQSRPATAFDGTDFLVVWSDARTGSSDIYGARVSRSGAILDPDGIAISTASGWQVCPAVAFDGTNSLVVWEDSRNSPGVGDIYGARVTSDGVVLDTSGIAISTADSQQEVPAIAFGGADYLVVWEDLRSGLYDDIYGARVTPAGAVLDSGGIVISSAADNQWHPAISFGGTNYLVVWEDSRSVPQWDIYGARVASDRVVLDTLGFTVSQAANGQSYPALAFDGANYLVAWTGGRSGDSSDIYGAWVSPAGTVSSEGAVVRQARDQQSPALCRGSGDQLFLAYQGWTGVVGGKAYSSDRIWGKMDPHPGIEEVENGEVRRVKGGATIVRGVLDMPLAAFRDGKPGQSTTGQSLVFLLDISGRKVLNLCPGPNDVNGLAAGVYFIRGLGSEVGGREEVCKVVIQR